MSDIFRSEKYADLTVRQGDILEWIMNFVRDHQSFPTVREIGQRFLIKSPNGVIANLNALVKKKYLIRHVDRSAKHRLALNEKLLPKCVVGTHQGAVSIMNVPPRMDPVQAVEFALAVLRAAEKLSEKEFVDQAIAIDRGYAIGPDDEQSTTDKVDTHATVPA